MIKITFILGFGSAMYGSLLATDDLWTDSYYHFMELAFVFYLLSFYLLSKKDSKEFSRFWQTITLVVFLSPVSTLCDEIFYNAKIVEWNDLFRMISIILVAVKIKYKIKFIYLWKVLWSSLQAMGKVLLRLLSKN